VRERVRVRAKALPVAAVPRCALKRTISRTPPVDTAARAWP
jgi:hypothetical protein